LTKARPHCRIDAGAGFRLRLSGDREEAEEEIRAIRAGAVVARVVFQNAAHDDEFRQINVNSTITNREFAFFAGEENRTSSRMDELRVSFSHSP